MFTAANLKKLRRLGPRILLHLCCTTVSRIGYIIEYNKCVLACAQIVAKNDSLLRILIYLITGSLHPTFSWSKVNDYRYLVLISRSLTLFVELKIKVQFFVVMKGHNFRFQSKIASITTYLCTNIKSCFIFYATGTCRKSFARIANYFPLPKNILIDMMTTTQFFEFSCEKETEIYLVIKIREKGVRHKLYAYEAILIMKMMKYFRFCMIGVQWILRICRYISNLLQFSDHLTLFYNASSTATC